MTLERPRLYSGSPSLGQSGLPEGRKTSPKDAISKHFGHKAFKGDFSAFCFTFQN